jgi:hypothetical protein
MKLIVFLFFLSGHALLYGQTITGTVFEKNSETPVGYVNIGIVGKNIGAVSDQNGKYILQISPEYYNDTLRFSCIGYHSYSVKVSDFINQNNRNVGIETMLYELSEVVVRPKKIKQKTLGITVRNRFGVECFADSVKGSEVGIVIKNKNRVFVNEVNLNISNCSYDTIFYRMNIYQVKKDMQFENILRNPVYVSSSKEDVKNKITVDLRHLNLVIEGDFLVTFEAVKDLGPGKLCFFACSFYKSYRRNASQGAWGTVSKGISVSVLVDIEK